MGKTVRRDRHDKKYTEGRYGTHLVYKCKCEYCTDQKRKNRYDTLEEQLELLNTKQ